MASLEQAYTLRYQTTLDLLSQQMNSKFIDKCTTRSGTGSTALRIRSTLAPTQSTIIVSRDTVPVNTVQQFDGRWVYPTKNYFGEIVNDIDLQQMDLDPKGQMVVNAMAAIKRAIDYKFLSAYFAAAGTGGATPTSTASFDAANVIAANAGTAGGIDGPLSVYKMEAALTRLLENFVDLENEQVWMAITPKGHQALKQSTVVTSSDFNADGRILSGNGNGMLKAFNGINLIVSNFIPDASVVGGSSNYKAYPVWVTRGMGRGVWKDLTGTVYQTTDPQRPWRIEAENMDGFVRMEEALCCAIINNEA